MSLTATFLIVSLSSSTVETPEVTPGSVLSTLSSFHRQASPEGSERSLTIAVSPFRVPLFEPFWSTTLSVPAESPSPSFHQEITSL